MRKKRRDRSVPRKKRATPVKSPKPVALQDEPLEKSPFPIVGIGASAGGLEAYTQLLKSLPPETGMGFVLVQHLDPEHESALVQILSRVTSLPVREIVDKQPVEPDHVYVIPRDRGLSIAQGKLRLGPRPKTRAPHRPIDSFFESLAQDQGDQAIGVVLSGTASDGTLGLEAIKAEGGFTFAQDDSAKHDSMPRSAVAAGCVDFVLSPAEIAQELARIAKHPYATGEPLVRPPRAELDRAEATAHADDLTPLPPGSRGEIRSGARQARLEAALPATDSDEGYKKILLLLRSHSGVDFSLYKSTTIQRRINRRMILTKHDSPSGYAAFLRSNVKELDALYSDVLISVTSFFRNPEMFDALKHTVLPKLLGHRGDGPLRCWVLGCSTGQEAYSIAMSFVEVAEKAPHMRTLQIFATDLNDALLDKARHGLYAKNLAEEISPERLRRFFMEEEGGYRITKPLREMVVFARQNLIADPPFSRMDLVSCRNLLIYLEPSLQKKALPTFHYALKPHGFLLLGASESIGGFTDLFESVDKKHKIYSRKPAPTPALHLPVGRVRDNQSPPGPRPRLPMEQATAESPEGFRGDLAAQREADRVSLSQYAPPGVLVSAELQVMQFRGPTGAYLELPPGKASFDVLKMAREGLMLPLRAAIHEARQANRAARRTDVRVKQNGTTRNVNLEVIPLKKLTDRCFLILFEEAAKSARAVGRAQDAAQPIDPPLRKKQERSRITELETDLAEMREYHQSIQEQHDAANEELQAANEEVQSTNEELQSVNEELETSKEELESANEELTTVNEEMQNRNLELNRLNNDLVNLQSSTQLPIMLLSRGLAIRRFSPQARKQFGLLATDVGRPIGHLRHNLVLPGSDSNSPKSAADLEHIAAEVISSVRKQVHEVHDQTGRWYSLRMHPYVTLDNAVDGAVLVLMDIDAAKKAELAVALARDYAENIVETVREPLLVLDKDLRVEHANRSFYRTFQVAKATTEGKSLFDLGNREWDMPILRKLLQETLLRGTPIEDYCVEHNFESIGTRILLLNARTVVDPHGTSLRLLLGFEDITERTGAEEKTARLAAIVTSSTDAIITKDLKGVITSWNRGAEHLFGYTAEEAIGKPGTLLIPEDRLDEEPKILEQLLRGEVIENYETVRQRKDGSLLDISLTVSPLRNAAGSVIGGSKIARDVTERVRTEKMLVESEGRFRMLADNISQFAWTADEKGSINWYNQRWYDYTGTTLEEMQGWGWMKVHHPDHVERVARDIQQAWETGEPWEDTFPLRGKDGAYRWFLTRVRPIRNEAGTVIRWFGTNTDVSEQREMDDQIKLQAGQMADESRRKDEFLAMLSHELRNPLAAIRSAEHVLRGHREGSDGSTQQAARAIIQRQVGVLTKLVSDLLDVSRAISGRIQLYRETVDLNQIVRHAAETVGPLLEKCNHELRLNLADEPLWADVDPIRMEEVFVNLLNNSAKYTDDGGKIEVHSEPDLKGGLHRLRIRDNGIGIDQDLMPHIFDLFTQADRSLARSAGGLGIGLSLARRLVELHGGTIEVHSPPRSPSAEKGAEFILNLPGIHAPESLPASELIVNTAPLRKTLKVLVVEDNIDQVTMLSSALKQLGHGVQTARNGLDGLKIASHWQPDIMLLDIGLPGLDGYEVARRLRSDPASSRIFLIAVTGYAGGSDVAAAREAGFDAHLSKPLNFTELEQYLARQTEQPARN